MDRRGLLTTLGILAAATAHAQSAPQDQAEKRFALIKQQAESYYPAITHASTLPAGVVIGLIVTPDLRVLEHSMAFDLSVGKSTTDEVREMFPAKRISRTGGGACFGGRAVNEPRYCVVWAELEPSGG